MNALGDLMMLVMLGVPLALAGFVAVRLAKSSTPSWRIPVWLPVLPVFLAGANVFIGVMRDPTSHNLWPFEMIVASLFSLVLFGIFLLARRLFG